MRFEWKRYKLTSLLIGVCIVVYIITVMTFGRETMSASQAIQAGGFNPLLIEYNHEYWRFITANFIHFGILHLLVNCYSLYNVGSFMERTFKPKHYTFILLISGIFTNVLPYIMYFLFDIGTFSVGGGISGVIFGLLGAMCVIAYRYKGVYYHIYRQLLPNILLMFGISILLPNISLWGHLGGFIGGILATWIVSYFIDKKKNQPLYN